MKFLRGLMDPRVTNNIWATKRMQASMGMNIVRMMKLVESKVNGIIAMTKPVSIMNGSA
jgi:hypothetical protein